MMAVHWTTARLSALRTAFEGAADPDRATQMARYMKDAFPFYGVAATERRAIQREVFRDAPPPTEHDVVRITRAAWRGKPRELQYFGADYVRRHVTTCSPAFLGHLELLITHKSWWDTVDLLAAHGVGALGRRFPEVARTMDAWIDADDFWLARTALLYQLGFKDQTNAEQLFRFCERRMEDTEFFVRKAIGWALREYSKTDAAAVRRFVRTHDASLSGLSKREALKWLARGQ